MTNVPDDELPWTPDDESESGLLAPDEPEDEPPQRGLLRAQIRLGVAGLVTIVGLWLAQALLPDAAYYLQNDAKPQRIESWAALAESGESLADLRNRFVDLSATPDVRTAAKLSRKDEAGDSTFVRIVESEMSLFVTMPRPPVAPSRTEPGSST